MHFLKRIDPTHNALDSRQASYRFEVPWGWHKVIARLGGHSRRRADGDVRCSFRRTESAGRIYDNRLSLIVDIETAIHRTNAEFIDLLRQQKAVAREKQEAKRK